MRNLYYGAFVPGMQEVVSGIVRERLCDVTIIKLLDGAMLFETECSYDRLNFFCFNNIFAVIDIMYLPSGTEGLDTLLKKIRAAGKSRGRKDAFSERALRVISENNKKIKTFRLVCSLENKPVSIDEGLKQDIEDFIARGSALKADRSRPGTEFWCLYRREGFSVFMKRLTRPVEKSRRPGELSPQLAWLLCRIGKPGPGETVLDPFCGYGSIPGAALKHFPIKKFYASDKDSRCVKIAASGLKNGRCEIHAADVFSVSFFIPKEGVDAIITDPPWGMYRETEIPLEKFYEETLIFFSGIIKPGGRAVVLTAARSEFETAAEKAPGLPITQVIPILVSGKKAAVYAMKKC
jgi:16S rRNA G966 N2-methylase RsmD